MFEEINRRTWLFCFVYLLQKGFECDSMPFRKRHSFHFNFAALMTLRVIWKCVEFPSSTNTLTKEQGEGRQRVFSMSKELFWMAIGRIGVKVEPIGLALGRWHDRSGRLTSQSKQWAERQWGVSVSLEGYSSFITIQFPTAFGFVFWVYGHWELFLFSGYGSLFNSSSQGLPQIIR